MFKKFLMFSVLLAFSACGNDYTYESPPVIEYTDDIILNEYYPDEIEYIPTLAAAVGEFAITFEFTRQGGWASNQYAIWIEDMAGNHIRTLAASAWTAEGGFYMRDMSLPMWVYSSGVAEMTSEQIDVFSSATPDSGMLTYIWDLTDMEGNSVPIGEYRFFIEGTTRWANQVVFEGVVDVGSAFFMANPEPFFIHQGSLEFPELHYTSEENYMIGNVTALFIVD